MKYKRSCGLLFFRHSFFFGFVSGDSEKKWLCSNRRGMFVARRKKSVCIAIVMILSILFSTNNQAYANNTENENVVIKH